MALKKPKEVPKIPKTREKSINKVKLITPKEKEGSLEFICKVFFYFNPHLKKQQYGIQVETVKQFSVMSYELTLKGAKSGKEIDISVMGLRAKQSYLNMAGPAYGEIYFDDLYGRHTINVIKQDGTINSAVFDFNIFKKEIVLSEEYLPEKKNNRRFCSFETAEEYFTFGD